MVADFTFQCTVAYINLLPSMVNMLITILKSVGSLFFLDEI